MMPMLEAARHDLYTGLAELFGLTRAETLMTHLPIYDPSEVATKTDIAELRVDITDLEARHDARFDRLDRRFDEMNKRLDELNKRLDRLFLTLLAGSFVVVGAMVTVVLATL